MTTKSTSLVLVPSPSANPQREAATAPAPASHQPPSAGGLPTRPAPSRPGNAADPAKPSIGFGGITSSQPAAANNNLPRTGGLFSGFGQPSTSAQVTNSSLPSLTDYGQRLFGNQTTAAVPTSGSLFGSASPGNPATAPAPAGGGLFGPANPGNAAAAPASSPFAPKSSNAPSGPPRFGGPGRPS
jgi:nuclear pore complex protein Nup62